MITLDPFYTVPEYLEALEALEFNDIEYWEYIDTRSKLWYLDLDSAVTHKCLDCANDRYLVPKVHPLEVLEEPALKRRAGDTSLERYLSNDFILETHQSGHSAVYVFLSTANDAQRLSDQTGHKIWWFGRYFNGLGVCACVAQPPITGKVIMAPLEAGLFDVEVRRQLLEYRGFLRKYTKQPYFLNGRFYGYKGRRIYDY